MADPSSIEEIITRLIRRERIANTLARDTAGEYRDIFRRIEEIIRRVDPAGVTRDRYRRERIAKVVEEVESLLRSAGPNVEMALREKLVAVGRDEAVATHRALVATVGTTARVPRTPITADRLRVILRTDPLQGRTLREQTRRIDANILDRVRSQVRLGMQGEETTAAIVRRVHRVRQTTERDAEALARTMVTGISNEAMLETFEAAPSVVTGVRYVATLDDRTTVMCLALDGTIWPVGSPEIIVPGQMTHYKCRSVLVPEIDYAGLGLPEPPEGARFARDLSGVSDEALGRPVSERRGAREFGRAGRISSGTTGEQWFRRQRAAVQDKLVGARRAQLFRDGEIGSLRDLIRGDLSTIPLEQLER